MLRSPGAGDPGARAVSEQPVPPREVEFWRDAYVGGDRVASEVIATGLEAQCGNVVVPRVLGRKAVVTLWLNVVDAAEDLGADHINYRCPVPVMRARRDLASGNTTPAVGQGKEQAR